MSAFAFLSFTCQLGQEGDGGFLIQTATSAPNNTREPAPECPRCGPTARAISLVQAQWIVAGIDKGET